MSITDWMLDGNKISESVIVGFTEPKSIKKSRWTTSIAVLSKFGSEKMIGWPKIAKHFLKKNSITRVIPITETMWRRQNSRNSFWKKCFRKIHCGKRMEFSRNTDQPTIQYGQIWNCQHGIFITTEIFRSIISSVKICQRKATRISFSFSFALERYVLTFSLFMAHLSTPSNCHFLSLSLCCLLSSRPLALSQWMINVENIWKFTQQFNSVHLCVLFYRKSSWIGRISDFEWFVRVH